MYVLPWCVLLFKTLELAYSWNLWTVRPLNSTRVETKEERHDLNQDWHLGITTFLEFKIKCRSKLKCVCLFGEVGGNFRKVCNLLSFCTSSFLLLYRLFFLLISENDRCQGAFVMHALEGLGQEVILLWWVSPHPCLLWNSPCLKCFQSKTLSVMHIT